MLKIISIFLFLHVIFVAFILVEQHRFKTNLTNSIFMSDGEMYSSNAWQISTALTGVIPDMQSISQMRGIHLADRAWGLERYYNDWVKKKIIEVVGKYHVGYITYFYSIVYAAYGFKPVFINFMNVILHLLTAILIYRSVEYIFDRRAAYLSALFFLLNPISFYYSSTKMSDPLFIFLVYLSVYFFIATTKKNYWHALFILPSFYIIHFALKPQSFKPLVATFAVSYLIIFFKNNKKIFFVTVLLIILFQAGIHTNILEKISPYVRSSLNSSVNHQRGFYVTGGQIYQLFIPGKESQDYTLADWSSYIFRGWYHMLSEPILSSNISPKLILLFPLKIIFLILCVFAVLGILMAMRYAYIEAVIFINIFIIIGTGIAMSSGNIGTMLRHRDLITPMVFIFSSFYITRFFVNKG